MTAKTPTPAITRAREVLEQEKACAESPDMLAERLLYDTLRDLVADYDALAESADDLAEACRDDCGDAHLCPCDRSGCEVFTFRSRFPVQS